MEDPVVFDLWGRLDRDGRATAATKLEASLGASRLEALKLVQKSLMNEDSVCLVTRLGWSEARRQLQEWAPVARDLRVYQAGYGPRDEGRLLFCERHDLHHGGCTGCPVCGGASAA